MNNSTPHSITSPLPPQYTEKKLQTRSRVVEPQNYGNGSWLVRRTSFTIESTPINDGKVPEQVDRVSLTSNAKSDDKKRLRNILAKWGNRQTEENQGDGRSIENKSDPFEASSQYGTTVSIEADSSSKPRVQRHHEMKGLEQAASMLRWPGAGKPADAWGKLAKVKAIHSAERLSVQPLMDCRTPNYGTTPETHSCILAIKDLRHLSVLNHQCWRTLSPRF